MFSLLHPGDRCGPYEIVRHLGSGRSAEVHLARTATGELFALKVMNAPGAGKKRARFAQEGEALAQIVHPNVIRVHDAGAEGDNVWLALELVEGETLAQKLRAGTRPPLEDLLDWMQQVCEGLAAAHRIHVVHRDVVLDNILVTRGGHVKLIDFGMSKMRLWGVASTSDQQLGSARNLAPEQAQGAPASPAMDLYALGHVLYEALAGVHAMGAAPLGMMSIIEWHFSTPPRPLQEIAPWVPSDLAALVHEALEKDPARRPASAHAVSLRLQRVCAGLRAPQLRAVRNLPGLDAAPVFAPTIPMAACEEPAPPAAATPPAAAATPSLPAQPAADREAMLPSAGQTLVSATAPYVAAPYVAAPHVATLHMAVSYAPAGAELRSTDVPVEGAARRSSITPRRVSAAALVLVGGAALAAAGWMLVDRLGGDASDPPRPAAPASASPPSPSPATVPAPATAAPTASASATVPPKAGPAKTPARHPAVPAPRAPARNRLFGTEP